MDRGGCRISAGQNEAAQRRQLRIHAVNFSLQPLDLSSDNAERHFARCKVFAGGCQIRAKIEEIILDATEHGCLSTITQCHYRKADGRSDEHTSELQSLMRISYAVVGLVNNKKTQE